MKNSFDFYAENALLKTIYSVEDNCHYTIATENYERVLIPDGSSYSSEEAKFIDEEIFCYVPEDVFFSSEEQIWNFIKENIL